MAKLEEIKEQERKEQLRLKKRVEKKKYKKRIKELIPRMNRRIKEIEKYDNILKKDAKKPFLITKIRERRVLGDLGEDKEISKESRELAIEVGKYENLMKDKKTDLIPIISRLLVKFDDYKKNKDIRKEIIERLKANKELKLRLRREKEEKRKGRVEEAKRRKQERIREKQRKREEARRKKEEKKRKQEEQKRKEAKRLKEEKKRKKEKIPLKIPLPPPPELEISKIKDLGKQKEFGFLKKIRKLNEKSRKKKEKLAEKKELARKRKERVKKRRKEIWEQKRKEEELRRKKEIEKIKREKQRKREEIKRKKQEAKEKGHEELEEKRKKEEERRRQLLAEEREKGLEKLKIREEEKKEREKEKKLIEIKQKREEKEEKREIQKAIEGVKKPKARAIGILKKLFQKKKELPTKKIPGVEIKIPLKEKVPEISKKKKKFDEVDFIKHRIYDARDALAELDLKRARHIYVEIMHSYNGLKDKDKAKVYEDIKGIYDDRQHAEAMFLKK